MGTPISKTTEQQPIIFNTIHIKKPTMSKRQQKHSELETQRNDTNIENDRKIGNNTKNGGRIFKTTGERIHNRKLTRGLTLAKPLPSPHAKNNSFSLVWIPSKNFRISPGRKNHCTLTFLDLSRFSQILISFPM